MHGPDDMKSVRRAEERPRLVHGVEALGLALGHVHQAHRPDGEAFLLDAGEDAAGLLRGDGVGLDDGERAVH